MKNNQGKYCTIYLVRHGQTEWNEKHIIMGQKDSPLTKLGLSQATSTAQELKNIQFDAIFSSDSLRAKRTAEIVKRERNLIIQTSELLRERSHGHFEGKYVSEYMKEVCDLYQKFDKLPEEEKMIFKFSEDMESDQQLITRVINQLREIALSFPNKKVLVVTHGGCIRTLLLKLGYATREKLQPGSFSNAGYVKLLSDGIDFIIKDVTGL
jgi:broad specificity phosphatase PhoE